jgi:hypothetical protein
MDDECDGCGGRLAHPHSLDRDTYASAESSKVIIGCQQNGEPIAKGCGTPLAIWQPANEIVGTPSTIRRAVRWCAISSMSVADRKVMAVRPDAIASRFLTRWLISPARSSCPSSACLRPVTSKRFRTSCVLRCRHAVTASVTALGNLAVQALCRQARYPRAKRRYATSRLIARTRGCRADPGPSRCICGPFCGRPVDPCVTGERCGCHCVDRPGGDDVASALLTAV